MQVKKEKCFLFYTQVKYVGHTLHEGQHSPVPGKVAAVREWSEDMIRMPKLMKSFLGICNWYSTYILKYASLAAPLMGSLAGKYRYGPDKRTSKVPTHKQTISWIDLMCGNFQKIKTSLCEACSLYIPSDQGKFATPRMRRPTALEQSWNRRKTRETGVPVLFSVENSRAAPNGTLTGRSWGIWPREHGQWGKRRLTPSCPVF